MGGGGGGGRGGKSALAVGYVKRPCWELRSQQGLPSADRRSAKGRWNGFFVTVCWRLRMEGDTTNCADIRLIASWSGLKLLIADGMIVPTFKRLIGCGANAIDAVSPLGALLREGQSLSAAKLPRGSDWRIGYDGRASLLIMFILSVYRSAGIGATFAGTDILVSGTGDLIFTTLRRR